MQPGIEDVVFCYLRFPSGLAAHLHLSWLDPHKERRFTVVGSKRMATFDDMEIERKVTVYDKGFDQKLRVLWRVRDALGRHLVAAGVERRAAAHRVPPLPPADRRWRASRARAARAACAWCACWRRCSARSRGARVLRQSERAPGLLLGEGVRLPDGVVLGGNVVIHDGTVIGDGVAHPGRCGARQAARARPALDRLAGRGRRRSSSGRARRSAPVR